MAQFNKALMGNRKLAVEAVIGEPVSVSEFSVSRENTGNFCLLSPVIAMQLSHSPTNSRPSHPIPEESEQGISLTEQGIARRLLGKQETCEPPGEL
jgi:hypothetical protein